MARLKVQKDGKGLKSVLTYDYKGYVFNKNEFEQKELEDIWKIRNDGGNPIQINLCSDNDPYVHFYIGGSLDEIRKGDLKVVGFSSDWKKTQEEYLSYKRGRGTSEAKFYLLIIFKVPKYNQDKNCSLSDKSDREIHDILEKRGYKKSREFYNDDDLGTELFHKVPAGQGISAVFEWFGKEPVPSRNLDFAFYPYQLKDASGLFDLLMDTDFNLDEYFYVAPTRSGKSFVIANVIQLLTNKFGRKDYVITTPHPDGYTSYDIVFNKHVDLEKTECFNMREWDLDELKKKAIENRKNGITNIFFLSWAKLKTKTKEKSEETKQINDTVKFLKGIEIFGHFKDEYHREADTLKSEEKSEEINATFEVGVSATPYEELMIGKITDLNSIIRILESIKKWRRENNIPDYEQSLWFKDFLQDVKDFLVSAGDFSEDEEFTWGILFEIIEEKKVKDKFTGKTFLMPARFKYEAGVRYLFKEYLSDPAKLQGISKYEEWLCVKLQDGRRNNVLDNILSFVPSSKAAILCAKLINEDPEFSSIYKALPWTSSNGEAKSHKNLGISKEYRGAESKITKWQQNKNEKGLKTIIITSESLTTAVTLLPLSSILLLRNISSVELLMQILGRCNNSGYELNEKDIYGNYIPRETSAIIPKGVGLELLAKIAPYAASIHNEENFEVALGKMLGNPLLFSYDGHKWNKIEESDLKKEIKTIIGPKTIGLDYPDVNKAKIKNLSDEEKQEYIDNINLSGKYNKKSNVKIIGEGGGGGRKTGKREGGKGKKESIDEILESQIRNLFKRIPFFVIVNNVNNIKDLYDLSDNLYETELKIEKNLFIKLFDDRIISEKIWNLKLKFKSEIDNNNNLKAFINRFDQINSFDISGLDNSIVFDQSEMTDRICKKKMDSLKKASGILIIEKDGAFLSSVLKIDYKYLKKIIIIALDPLSKKIISYLLGDDLKLIQLFCIKNINNMEEEFREILKRSKSFDVALANSPYKKNLHLKLLRILYKSPRFLNTGIAIWLQPARWIQDLLAPMKKNSDFNKYKDLGFVDFEIIPCGEASKLFKNEMTSDLSLSELIKGKNSILDENKLFELRSIPISFKRFLKLGCKTLKEVAEKDKIDGIRVRIRSIAPNTVHGRDHVKGRYDLLTRSDKVLIDGKYKEMNSNGKYQEKDWTEMVQRNQFTKPIGSPIPLSIGFNTVEEGQNFIDSTFEDFYIFLLLLTKVDATSPNSFLPFMGDYREPWTNKRFKIHFKVSNKDMRKIKSMVKKFK